MSGNFRFLSAGPLPVLAIVLFIALIILLIPLFVLGMIGAAFTRLGLSWIAALALVLLMFAGSFVNIPLYSIKRDMIRAVPLDSSGNELQSSFRVPPVWETVISINAGGGIIPVCVSGYMVYQAVVITATPVLESVILCAALVTVITYLSRREIPGLGIYVPLFIPALMAILVGFLLTGSTGLAAAVTALAGGTLGTLVGGNLAHLRRVQDLEIPEASIGGTGTFGAVFLCCILPALIA